MDGAVKLSPVEVDQEIIKWGSAGTQIYKQGNGIDFLNEANEIAEVDNFELYYKRLKKISLLRRLHLEKYDISKYYMEKIDDPYKEQTLRQNFEDATLEDILNNVEGKFNIIRNDYLNGGKQKGDPADGIVELINDLKASPNIGLPLEGDIFSYSCRGARLGCFYLKSASSGSGKTRTSVFDACRLAYPIRWSHDEGIFCYECNKDGTIREAEKVLFIVTEMDKEELQTIILAYLSGVNEDHILKGHYDTFGEEHRVRYAAEIIKKYSGYFLIEEISDPNLVNVEATIKRYVTVDGIKYVFFDYIHSTASMIGQFAKSAVREDSILMMMANQLKQIAKDYNIFIFSATQVNATAMSDDGEFKNETSIRGAKSISDKSDLSYVMTRVEDKVWNSVKSNLKIAVREGNLDEKYVNEDDWRPTHIIDIYKMRRGRYKNVRIWIKLDLGTGYRKDLFMTNPANIVQPVSGKFTYYTLAPVIDWKDDNSD